MRATILVMALSAAAPIALHAAVALGQEVNLSGQVQVGPSPSPPPPPVYTAPPPPPVYSAPPAYPVTTVQPLSHAPRWMHEGFYLRAAIGGGGMSAATTTDLDSVELGRTYGGGVATNLAIGGAVARGVVVAGDYTSQFAFRPRQRVNGVVTTADTDLTLHTLGVMVDWFPAPSGGFHVSGSLAFAALEVSDQGGVSRDTEFGGSLSLGVGYDFWIARKWSLGALLRLTGASVRTDNGTNTSSVTGVTTVGTRDEVGAASLMFSVLYY